MTNPPPEYPRPSAKLTPRPISTELGRAASHNLRPSSEAPWEQSSGGLQLHIPGIYLGILIGDDGWNAGFIDRKKSPIPVAGFSLEVEQNSLGNTGLLAEALEGHTVEVADFNTETGTISWRGPNEIGRLRVDVDGGNLSQLPPTEWLTANFGNPGVRAGVIRITDPEQQAKYYAVGANFTGEPDRWNVEGGVVELTPREMPSVVDPTHNQNLL